MRKMFLKKDWKNIKDVFLDNNIVLLMMILRVLK